MKLNSKGMSIIEVVVTFSLIMFMVIGLLVIVVNYRNKVSVSLERLSLDTFKNNLTQDINNDILTLGLKEINTGGECTTLDLNRCINLVFYDPDDSTKTIDKAFGTSKIIPSDKNSVENKYFYYDGLKYKLKDVLPNKLPEGRSYNDLAQISVVDDSILNSSYTVLEDGTKIYIYNIDINVYHVDFKDDFGIHIVASTDNISL